MQGRAGIGLLNKELDNSILPDLPGNTNSDMCLNNKESAVVQLLNASFLSEYLTCEVTKQNKKCYVFVVTKHK